MYKVFLSLELLIIMNCLVQVIQREPWEHIKDVDIKKTAASFCGEIWQVPPMFSAIKVRSFPDTYWMACILVLEMFNCHRFSILVSAYVSFSVLVACVSCHS